jgi:hypothetical protein
MGRLRVVYGDYADAGDLFERTIIAVERAGDDLGVALALTNVAARLTAGDNAAQPRPSGLPGTHARGS